MPWYYFNFDGSCAYVSEDQLDPEEMEKLSDEKYGSVTEVYDERTELELLPDDADDDQLWIDDDGNIGVNENVYIHGTKRHIRLCIDYFQMYSPLDELDRPDNYDNFIAEIEQHVPTQVMDRMLDDGIITNEEKQELYRLCGV